MAQKNKKEPVLQKLGVKSYQRLKKTLGDKKAVSAHFRKLAQKRWKKSKLHALP